MSWTTPQSEMHHGREEARDSTSEQTKSAAMLESGGTDLAGFPSATSGACAAFALAVARGRAHAPTVITVTSTLRIVRLVTVSWFSIPNITITAPTCSALTVCQALC